MTNTKQDKPDAVDADNQSFADVDDVEYYTESLDRSSKDIDSSVIPHSPQVEAGEEIDEYQLSDAAPESISVIDLKNQTEVTEFSDDGDDETVNEDTTSAIVGKPGSAEDDNMNE